MIDARDVSRSFGRTMALDHVSFRVEPGEIVGFLGPNGAGKTTTLRMVVGLLRPDAGAVSVYGVDALANHAEQRQVAFRVGIETLAANEPGHQGDASNRP